MPRVKGVVARYRRDGHVLLHGILGPQMLEASRRHMQEVRRTVPPGTAILACRLGRDPFADSLVADAGGPLGRLAQDLLGSTPVCFGYTYIVKQARTGVPALWHQDGYPWEQSGIKDAVTLWVALDAVDADNGALVVLKGSHRQPARPLEPTARPDHGGYGGPGEGDLFGGGIDPGPLDPATVTVVAMQPGDVSAHHPHLIHASGPNRSERDRRALVVRYRPAQDADGVIRSPR